MRVDVSHPGGNALARHLFAAIIAAGYDGTFYTGLYAQNPEKLSALRVLPRALRDRLAKELKRRSHPGIAQGRVKSFPGIELPHLLAARMGLPTSWLYRMRQYRDGQFDARVARELHRSTPDVFIGHDASSLASLRAVKAMGKMAVLNQVVGFMAAGETILRQEAEAFPAFVEKGAWWGNDSRLQNCRHEVLEADRILVPSEYVRDTLLAEGVAPDRIVLLPYGVDIERFQPGRPHDDTRFRLLFVGQIGVRKGVPYLLEAMRRLGREDIELTMMGPIVGSSAGLAPYRHLFRHIPSVPNHEIHRFYQEADAFVFPSLHEGSAFVTFEALAAGLPVITTHNSGSVVRNGTEGLIVAPRDIAALAEAISRLADNRDLRRTMALNARKRAENYTWEHYRMGLAHFLQECAGQVTIPSHPG